MSRKSKRRKRPERGIGAAPPVFSLAVAAATVATIGLALDLSGVVPASLLGQNVSMDKYEILRAQVPRDGPNDVLVIGSSAILRGVIPAAMAEELAVRLDAERKPRVFNFGIPGHNVLTYPMLVKLVLGVDRPGLFVFHVAPRSIDATAEHLDRWTRMVLESPYGRALEDAYRPRGWLSRLLLDHWFLRGYAPTLRARLLGEPLEPRHQRRGYDRWRGYAPAPRSKTTPKALAAQRAIVRDWSTAPRFANALDRAVERARAVGADVLLVDAPMGRTLRSLMKDPERNMGGVRDFLDSAAQRLDVSVAHVPENLVGEDDFADLTHLTPSGAEVYSRWLAAEIARSPADLLQD
jgi:hypothetical protein